MVVHDLDVLGVAVRPAKADPPLIVDPDTVLSGAIAFELLESVAWWDTKVFKCLGSVHSHQLPQHHPSEVGRIPADRLPVEQAGSVPVAEALDHARKLTRRVNNVKRYDIAS